MNDKTRNLLGEKDSYSLSFDGLTSLRKLHCVLNWDLSVGAKIELTLLPSSLEDLALEGECLIIDPNELDVLEGLKRLKWFGNSSEELSHISYSL